MMRYILLFFSLAVVVQPHSLPIPGGRGLPMIVVHGGAGSIDAEAEIHKNNGTKAAIRAAYQILTEEGGSAMEAVVAAIKVKLIS